MPLNYSINSSVTHLFCSDKGFRYFSVASSVAGGDEVSDTAALQECGGTHFTFAEQLCECDHFHQTEPDHRCLSVVSKAQAVTEPGTDCNNILTNFNTQLVRHF